METLHNISSARNKSHFRFRSVLIVTGIVIAIICSLVSLKDIHAVESAEGKTRVSMETPRLAKVDMLVNTVSTIRSISEHAY